MKTQCTNSNFKSITPFIMLLMIIMTGIINLQAQSFGEIHGRIVDANTNEPLPNGHIIIYRGESILMGCTSDLDGYFKIKPVPVGTHNITIKYTGYTDSQVLGVMVDADKITNLKEISVTSGYTLGPVIITWKKDLVDADDPSKKTMDMKVIKKIPGTSNFPTLLAAIGSDIMVSEDQKDVYFRGSRANDAVYIIDGVKMVNPGAMIPTRGIGNMTIYSGGVPAKYGDFTGGVVIIESASYFDWLSQEKAKELMK